VHCLEKCQLYYHAGYVTLPLTWIGSDNLFFYSEFTLVFCLTAGSNDPVLCIAVFPYLIFHLIFMVFSALVVATSGAGYVLGSGNIVEIAGLCFTCTGTMMVAASANTLNQVHDTYF
jgi:hypothetical protein